MFGLFKRTKIENWETDLLRKVIIKLPSEYSGLIDQIDAGLFRGVLVDVSDIKGYVAFTFNSNILKKYNNDSERDYKLTNIKVYDNKSLGFIPYEVYVSSGTISGYSLGGTNKNNVDLSKIDVLGFKKELINASDFNRIIHVLDAEEKKLINPSEVYSVFVADKEYFHIKDLEDGDFIGMDENKVVYKISHDFMEAVETSKKLAQVLKE